MRSWVWIGLLWILFGCAKHAKAPLRAGAGSGPAAPVSRAPLDDRFAEAPLPPPPPPDAPVAAERAPEAARMVHHNGWARVRATRVI